MYFSRRALKRTPKMGCVGGVRVWGLYIYIHIYIPVNPLPGVETNGSLIDWSMVPSWVAGCRFLTTWLHTGYRVTHYLDTGSRLIALPILRNPMRCLVFCELFQAAANASRTVHYQMME